MKEPVQPRYPRPLPPSCTLYQPCLDLGLSLASVAAVVFVVFLRRFSVQHARVCRADLESKASGRGWPSFLPHTACALRRLRLARTARIACQSTAMPPKAADLRAQLDDDEDDEQEYVSPFSAVLLHGGARDPYESG